VVGVGKRSSQKKKTIGRLLILLSGVMGSKLLLALAYYFLYPRQLVSKLLIFLRGVKA
jgi:hypothetical protein